MLDRQTIKDLFVKYDEGKARKASNDLLQYAIKLPDGALANEVLLALSLLGSVGGRGAVGPLVKQLETHETIDGYQCPEYKDHICRTLGLLGDHSAADSILKFLQQYGRDISRGCHAVRALGRLHCDKSLPVLAIIACELGFCDKSWEAARAMRIIGAEPARPVFAAAMKHPSLARHVHEALWIIDKPTASRSLLDRLRGRKSWLAEDRDGLARFLTGYEESSDGWEPGTTYNVQ